jgi:hypothetical protein
VLVAVKTARDGSHGCNMSVLLTGERAARSGSGRAADVGGVCHPEAHATACESGQVIVLPRAHVVGLRGRARASR